MIFGGFIPSICPTLWRVRGLPSLPVVVRRLSTPSVSTAAILAVILALTLTGPALPSPAAATPLVVSPKGKSLGTQGSTADAAVYSFSLGSAVDILRSSTDTDLYDPITLQTLKRLRDEAQPVLTPTDFDPEKVRGLVEKAFAIQAGRSMTNLLSGSELSDSFHAFQRSVKKIQDTFRYSVQNDGSGLVVTKEQRGRKILELSLEVSVKQGFDPQIRLGESFRFRYDYTEKTPMLEYGFRF